MKKDKLLTNIVGVITTEEVRESYPTFNPNDFDADEVLKSMVENGNVRTILNKVISQFKNNSFRVGQKVSLDYFLGNNDITKFEDGDTAFTRNPLTGLFEEVVNPVVYFNDRIVSSFHETAITNLTGYTFGAKPPILKFNEDEKPSENLEKKFIEYSKNWNHLESLDRQIIEDWYLFGFSGVRHTPIKSKTLLGEEEWIMRDDIINPVSTYGFTFGRVENKINNADVIITYNIKVDGQTVESKFDLITNKAQYTIDYEVVKDGDKVTEQINNAVREPLWVKETEEVDFIKPPFSFMEPTRFVSLLISKYKGLIDADDKLSNSVVDDSVNHDEKILFIKGAALGHNYKETLDRELAALGKARKENQKGFNAIYADSNDADIKTIDNELPTAHTELAFGAINDKLYNTAGLIDYNSSHTNENYNAIKMKYNKILNKIKPIREKFSEFKIEGIKYLTIFLGKTDKKVAKEIIKKINKVSVKFDDTFLINELDVQNAIAAGVGGGFLSKKTASEASPFAADDEYSRIKTEIDSGDFEIKEIEKSSQDTQGNRAGGTTSGDIRQMK